MCCLQSTYMVKVDQADFDRAAENRGFHLSWGDVHDACSQRSMDRPPSRNAIWDEWVERTQNQCFARPMDDISKSSRWFPCKCRSIRFTVTKHGPKGCRELSPHKAGHSLRHDKVFPKTLDGYMFFAHVRHFEVLVPRLYSHQEPIEQTPKAKHYQILARQISQAIVLEESRIRLSLWP